MRWYTCINEAGLARGGEGLIACVLSCLSRTSLEPTIVFDGAPNPLMRYLERCGASVVYRRVGLRQDLAEAIQTLRADERAWITAVMLRFDIPFIDGSTDCFLYTDTDVLFIDAIEFDTRKVALAAANEIIISGHGTIETRDAFNAGVVVMRSALFRDLHDEFVDLAVSMARGTHNIPWYDQGIMNVLLRKYRTTLDQSYNFRPYHHNNEQPRIVHFQFLKLNDIFSPHGEYCGEFVHLWHRGRRRYIDCARTYLAYIPREGINALKATCPEAMITDRNQALCRLDA